MTAKKTLLKILLSVTAAVLFMSAASLNPFAGVPSQNEGAKKNEVICPYCQYKNSPDDEYCLDCSKSIRNDTPARLLAMEKIKESRRGFITDEKRLAIYQEAIEIDPSFTEPYFLRMQLLRSMKDKNPEGMMADIQKCIELDPENDKYYFERAVIKYNYFNDEKGSKEDYRKAGELKVKKLEKKVASDPENRKLWKELAIALKYIKRYDQAAEAFKKTAELQKQNLIGESYKYLAECYDELGRKEQAKEVRSKIKVPLKVEQGNYLNLILKIVYLSAGFIFFSISPFFRKRLAIQTPFFKPTTFKILLTFACLLFVPSSIYFFIYSICASIYAPPVLACMQLHRVNSSWVLIPALNILFYTGIYYLAACFIERFVPSLLVLILMVFLLFGQTFKPQIGDRSIAKSRYSRINILISYENYLVNKEIMK